MLFPGWVEITGASNGGVWDQGFSSRFTILKSHYLCRRPLLAMIQGLCRRKEYSSF